jgi:PIN domain nuclease of toxin-antitoxin system
MNKTNMMDASAIIATILKEKGYLMVESMLEDMTQTNMITAVNASEVLHKLMEKGFTDEEAIEAFESLNLTLIPIDYDLAKEAAAIWFNTRAIGASLGDRFCLAAARHMNAQAITAEKSWQTLKMKNLHVMCIR